MCAYPIIIFILFYSIIQAVPIFTRMLDKDTFWGKANGLATLIPTLLHFSLEGYVFVLPDMIGGNGYNTLLPAKELFVRWMQANVFMPSLQFSYAPWDYDAQVGFPIIIIISLVLESIACLISIIF